jgi:hypothetical protein
MGFRSQTLINLLTNLDRRTNTTDEDLDSGNVVQDQFVPVSERLATSDTVTVEYFTPSVAVWGNGTLTASSAIFVSATNVTL